MWKILGLVVVLSAFRQGYGETGCPDAEEIQPCTCNASPWPTLFCQNVTDAEDLRNVFNKSERYTYNEVYLQDSSMQFLPSDMFETVKVNTLHLERVVLIALFDKPPKALDMLRTLHIENCRVKRGIFWRILEPLTGLKILNVYVNSIKTLGEDFSKYAPVGLEQLALAQTGTKVIKPGVFLNFTKLSKIDIQFCKLTALTRDMFPTPFDVQALYFGYNKITTIPEGLFKNMPKLTSLSLSNNEITTIPENAFDSRFSLSNFGYLNLEGNPFKCDCLMVWIVPYKPPDIRGTCVYPKWMAGKQLKDLQRGNFNC